MLLLAKQSLDEAPYKLFGAVVKLASITFSRIVCSSPERLNLGFLMREKTCRYAYHTFRLEFPNCLAIIIINYTPAIKPSALGENYSLLIIGDINVGGDGSEVDGDGIGGDGVDGDGSRGTSLSWQGAETETSIP
jgi:hypothetical protein